MIREILKKNAALTVICAVFFAAGIPFGYLLYDQSESVMMPVLEELKDLATKESKLETVEYILFNNYRVCIYLLIAGILIAPTFLVMLANGFVIGFLIKLLEKEDLGPAFLLKGITAHGIFELPAIFISAAVGLRIGIAFLTPHRKRLISDTLLLLFTLTSGLAALALGAYASWAEPAALLAAAIGTLTLVMYVNSDQRKKTLLKSIREASLIHFLVVVPLLIIAAFVEVFISAALVAR